MSSKWTPPATTGVDDIRSLREKSISPRRGARRKVYIIDEVHMLSTALSNALLKTLEEPPPHVVFILATTEVHKLLPTILSRCQRFDFPRLTRTAIVRELTFVCEKEGITAEAEAIQMVARAATGTMRDALNLFQQLYTYYGSNITLRHVQDLLGMSGDQRARQLVKNILDYDVAAGVSTVNAVRSDGLDLRQFNHDVVDYLRTLMLVKTGATESIELAADELTDTQELARHAPCPDPQSREDFRGAGFAARYVFHAAAGAGHRRLRRTGTGCDSGAGNRPGSGTESASRQSGGPAYCSGAVQIPARRSPGSGKQG
jgi:DNA polymerase-3 subunit gamma/tau